MSATLFDAPKRQARRLPPLPAKPNTKREYKPLKLSLAIPRRLVSVICDQWDLYAFVVPQANWDTRFSRKMPDVCGYLRAQARRIPEVTGQRTYQEIKPDALLQIEGSPEGLYALLFFCCNGPSTALDAVRDVIEPILRQWEARVACGELADDTNGVHEPLDAPAGR